MLKQRIKIYNLKSTSPNISTATKLKKAIAAAIMASGANNPYTSERQKVCKYKKK